MLRFKTAEINDGFPSLHFVFLGDINEQLFFVIAIEMYLLIIYCFIPIAVSIDDIGNVLDIIIPIFLASIYIVNLQVVLF
jgi:hypothetical protein